MSSRIFAAGTVVCSLMATLLAADTPPTQPARPDSIPKDWIQYHAREAFSFWAPADLVAKKTQGIDSYVGEWSNKTMTVSFDYGWYSGKYEGDQYTQEKITVDARQATLSTSKAFVGLYVGEVHKNVKLSIGVTCKEDQIKDAALLLRSITFGKSETRSGQ